MFARLRARSALLCASPLLLALSVGCSDPESPSYASVRSAPFEIEETTIAGIHRGFARGSLTASELVDAYLARIARYDESGPALNSVLALNPNARARAAELDAEYAATGRLVGPLHGIPVIVKDNLDTYDQPTTAGVAALLESVPSDDAFVVQRLRDAGAIVIGKANMMELGVLATMSLSSAGGMTRNAYDPARSSLGSSGGTAVAVAANLSAVGLGTDTNSSIVSPSAANGLVGLRPSLGLVSRDGIVTGLDDTTVPGPMTRTVEDAARMLEVIAGSDARDPSSARCGGVPHGGYVKQLDKHGLRHARLGAVLALIESSRFLGDTTEVAPAALALAEQALAAMKRGGAQLADVSLSAIEERVAPLLEAGSEDLPFKFYLNRYLATLPAKAPMHSLTEIVASGEMLPEVLDLASYADSISVPPEESTAQQKAARGRAQLSRELVALMDERQLDALVYLTIAAPAAPLGTEGDPYGVSGSLSALSGLPSITVPMGLTKEGLPLGITLLARPCDEARLLRLAFAYEQKSLRRRGPHLDETERADTVWSELLEPSAP